jgi:membrane protein required for colicin V production
MYIDIFLAVCIVIGIIQGFHRGVVRTLFAILGILIGILAALKFSPFVVTFLEQSLKLSPVVALILGMVLTFLVLMLGIRWLGKGFENTLKLAKINILNKILGAGLFAVIMIVMYSAIIWFADRTELLGTSQKEQSRSYPYLAEVPVKTGALINAVKPVFVEFWNKLDAVTESKTQNGTGQAEDETE